MGENNVPTFNKNDYLQKINEIEKYKKGGVTNVTSPITNEQFKKQASNNPLERVVATQSEYYNNLFRGVVKFAEGVVDLVATGVGAVGGKFNKEFGENVSNFVKEDWSSNPVVEKTSAIFQANPLGGGIGRIVGGFDRINNPDAYKVNTYTNELDERGKNIVTSVETSIGEMLPSIMIGNFAGAIAKGVGLSAKAINFAQQAGSLASMGISAGGSGSEEALNEGANIDQALGYGTLAGLTEVGTELISVPFTGKAIPGLSNISKQISKVTLGKMAKTFVSEGLEEVASDFLDPIWKGLCYKGKIEWDTNGMVDSFLSGGICGVVMETPNFVTSYSEKLKSNKEAFKQLQSDFENGVIGEDQYTTEKKKILDSNERLGKQFADAVYSEEAKKELSKYDTSKEAKLNGSIEGNSDIYNSDGNNISNTDANGNNIVKTTNKINQYKDTSKAINKVEDTTKSSKDYKISYDNPIEKHISEVLSDNGKNNVIINRKKGSRTINGILKSYKDNPLTNHTAVEIANEISSSFEVTINGDKNSLDSYMTTDEIIKEMKATKVSFKNTTELTDYLKDRLVRTYNKLIETKQSDKLISSIKDKANNMINKSKNANKTMSIFTSDKVKKLSMIFGKDFKSLSQSKNVRSHVKDIITSLYIQQTAENMASNGGFIDNKKTVIGVPFNQDTYNSLSDIANGKGKLSNAELKVLNNALKEINYGLNHIVNDTYVGVDGKEHSLKPDIEKYTNKVKEMPKKTTKIINSKSFEIFSYLTDFKAFSNKMDNFNIDGGKGYFTQIYENIKQCQDIQYKHLLDLYAMKDKFYKENKGFKKHLLKNVDVTINGKKYKMSYGTLLSLYCTSLVESGKQHIINSGFTYYKSPRERIHIHHADITESFFSDIKSNLTESDLKAVDLTNNIMNYCKELKSTTDNQMYGWTNVEEGFYYPTNVSKENFAQPMGEQTFDNSNKSVANKSFNKNKKSNLGDVIITDWQNVVGNHISEMCIYNAYATEIDRIKRTLYSKYKDESGHIMQLSLAYAEKGYDSNFMNKYLNEYLNDIQGMSAKSKKSGFEKAFSFIRKNAVTNILGVNLTSAVRQMSSYPGAMKYVSLVNLGRAFSKSIYRNGTISYIKENSPYLAMRMYSDEVIKANAVLDSINKVNTISMKPLSITDSMTIEKQFIACEFQIESNHKGDKSFKFGTEKNKAEAIKLCEDVVRETQPNFNAVERSAFQRTNSEVEKLLGMYMTQPLKNLSRCYEAFEEVKAWKKAYKLDYFNETYEKGYEKAKKNLGKALLSVTAQGTLYTLMGTLMKMVMGKKDWDDWNEKEFVKSVFDNSFVGMFPVIKDLYGYFTNDYDIGFNSLSAVQDICESVKKITNSFIEQLDGKEVNWASTSRELLFSLGKLSGTPTKNIYDIVYGLIHLFDPQIAYKTNNLFYNYSISTESKNLKDAVKKNDDDKAKAIIETMFDGYKTGETPSNEVVQEILNLYKDGYTNVIPTGLYKEITIDGYTYELKESQKKKFNDKYSKANYQVDKVVKTSIYKKLDNKVKTSVIRKIYNGYYELAKMSLKSDYTSSNKVANILKTNSNANISKLLTYYLQTTNIKSDKDIANRKTKVINYINKSINLTKEEKVLLKYLCGYDLGIEDKATANKYNIEIKQKNTSSN